MYFYLYLLLGIIFVAVCGIIAVLRADLRRPIAYAMLAGALWGPISEAWYFTDYWHPLSVIGHPVLEDCIYGSGIAGTAAVAYRFVFRRKLDSRVRLDVRAAVRGLGIYVMFYIAAMLALKTWLGLNSIWVSCLVYLVCTVAIVGKRPDLLINAVASAVLMAAGALLGYGIGLNYVVNGQAVLHQIWFLYEKPGGAEILGSVPASEVVWYACWGALLGVAFEHFSGTCDATVDDHRWKMIRRGRTHHVAYRR